MLSCILITLGVIGLMYSCSNAQPSATKNSSAKKTVSTVSGAAKSAQTDTALKSQSVNPINDRKTIVYYFMTSARCPTCYKLENLAKSEVEKSFPAELKNGTLQWQTVNVDEKQNAHFAADYKLYTKAVVISIQEKGAQTSWKNLDQIWQLVHEESKYREYIKSEVKACLSGKCL